MRFSGSKNGKVLSLFYSFFFRLEAVYCGCVPLAPNKLVYPEIYPDENLYNTEKQLVKKLQNWCKNPSVFHKHRRNFFKSFNFDQYSSSRLVPVFENLLKTTASR